MIHLLDVNVLIALLDPEHIAHDDVHVWFDTVGKTAWATCPIVQNGFLRIVGASRYSSVTTPLPVLVDNLSEFTRRPGHHFWAEDFSLLTDVVIRREGLTNAAQLTDTYLLGLAVRNGGRLATMDRRLSTRAVVGGDQALVQILVRPITS
ncbi:TA system VapC family ribonuclease toxin [Brevundimonas sp.]